MLQVDELLELSEMPSWSEIRLKLYRDFANKYLIPTCFRYYLANEKVLEIHFTEWGIYHMLGIQHISRSQFLNEVINPLMEAGDIYRDGKPKSPTSLIKIKKNV